MAAQEIMVERMDRFTVDVAKERVRQVEKWGDQRIHSALYWFAILAEETGEVAKAILQQDWNNLRTELIQSAAVIATWIEAIDAKS